MVIVFYRTSYPIEDPDKFTNRLSLVFTKNVTFEPHNHNEGCITFLWNASFTLLLLYS